MSDFFGKKEYPKLKGFADDLRLWFLSTSLWAANASSFTHIDWRKMHHSEVPLVIQLHSCVCQPSHSRSRPASPTHDTSNDTKVCKLFAIVVSPDFKTSGWVGL
jgi:hypothetical protein